MNQIKHFGKFGASKLIHGSRFYMFFTMSWLNRKVVMRGDNFNAWSRGYIVYIVSYLGVVCTRVVMFLSSVYTYRYSTVTAAQLLIKSAVSLNPRLLLRYLYLLEWKTTRWILPKGTQLLVMSYHGHYFKHHVIHSDTLKLCFNAKSLSFIDFSNKTFITI